MQPDGVESTFTQYVIKRERILMLMGVAALVERAEQDTPTYYQIIQTLHFSASSQPM